MWERLTLFSHHQKDTPQDYVRSGHNRIFSTLIFCRVPTAGITHGPQLPWNSVDWATAVVGEADKELTCVTLTYHSSGPIYETLAQSMKSPGT